MQGYGALGLGHDRFEVIDYTKVNIDKSLGKVSILSGSTDYLAAITGSYEFICFLFIYVYMLIEYLIFQHCNTPRIHKTIQPYRHLYFPFKTFLLLFDTNPVV